MISKHTPPYPALLRLKSVLAMIPVSKSSWWGGVKQGRFPKPIYLGVKTPVWRETDILALISRGLEQNNNEK